jgi:hypothetical protein
MGREHGDVSRAFTSMGTLLMLPFLHRREARGRKQGDVPRASIFA